jgi:SAM-dependent MidA family methyltransferase
MAAMLSVPGMQSPVDIVEGGAGDGQLSADILDAAETLTPEFYRCLRLHLVEASAAARACQARVLGRHADRLASSDFRLPESFEGVLIANELLDAMPVHQLVMREGGIREVYVTAAEGTCEGRPMHSAGLLLMEGPVSTPALGEYLRRLGAELEPGWRVEINLRAVDWIRDAVRRLRRGFIIIIDYGHEAGDLYGPSHSAGTLTSFHRHCSSGPERTGAPAWLQSPGEQDITSHVDFTSVRAAAESEGARTLGLLDQTYFLLGLVLPEIGTFESSRDQQARINSLKTLVLPGGLGSTHKVMIFGKGVGTPALLGCSYWMRVT